MTMALSVTAPGHVIGFERGGHDLYSYIYICQKRYLYLHTCCQQGGIRLYLSTAFPWHTFLTRNFLMPRVTYPCVNKCEIREAGYFEPLGREGQRRQEKEDEPLTSD